MNRDRFHWMKSIARVALPSFSLRKPTLSDFVRYGVASLSVLVALVLMLALDSVVQMKQAPFLLFFGAVMISAWYGGRGPGILATIICAVISDYLFLEPVYSFRKESPDENIKLFVFVAEGVLISLLGGVLQQLESRNAEIMRTATDGVITIDDLGRVLEFNPAAEQIFGYERAHVLGREIAELIVPERLRDRHRAGLQHYLATGEGPVLNQRIEMPALRADGREIPVELSIIRIPTDGPPLFTGFVRDISTRRQMEQQLARQTQVTRLLQLATALSDSTLSYEKALQSCLDLVCEITSWPVGHICLPDESQQRLVSSNIWHLHDSDTYAVAKQALESTACGHDEGLAGRIWTSGESAWITNINVDDNFPAAKSCPNLGIKGAVGFPVKIGNEIVAVLEFFSPDELMPDKQLLLLVAGVGDQLGRVIERRRQDEERSRLAAIVDSSYDAIIGWGMDGTITSWNDAAQRVYGYTHAEAVGQPISILLPPDMSQEESVVLEAMRTGRRLEQFEARRRRKDGRIVLVSITVSPIRDGTGRITGASKIVRDITRRKQAETELLQAKEAAEAANQAKSEFLANVSHEVRTPMNAILGMLGLALREDLTPMMRDYLATAKDSADTLLFLLNDILDFSRMEAGRFELESNPFSIRETLDETMKTLSVRAHEKGLELVCHVHNDVPDQFLGDGRRLRQVVMNLVSNAIKFTEHGEVVVDVAVDTHTASRQSVAKRAASDESSGDDVALHFTVADTGIGIAPQDHEKIFEPFTQVDPSSTRKQSGTGLGLSICRELVSRMGGRVWVESKLGRGSRFHCTTRFRALPADAESSSDQPAVVSSLRDLRVLIVDDNQTNRRILEELLTGWGMKPYSATDGRSALEMLRDAAVTNHRFPLLIVDALMPEMDGFRFVEQVRQDHRLDGAIVLMLSASDRQAFQQRASQLGIAAYLEKPISRSELLETMLSALKWPHLRQASGDASETTLRPLRILLAEDTPANQKVLRMILTQRGHSVQIARNGREAIDQVEHGDFDVVLMDVQMPTLDGLQATRSIRQLKPPAPSQIPIVAMTAHAMPGDREHCLAAGMNAYISKPVDAAKLIRVVERLAARTALNEGDGRTATGKRAIIPDSAFFDVVTAPEPFVPPLSVASAPVPVRNSTSTPAPIINRGAALERMGGDETLFQSVVRFFDEDSPVLLAQIRAGIRAGDAEQVMRAAHSLKGLAANFNAETTVAVAMQMQEMGEAGAIRVDEALGTLSELEREVSRLNEALAPYRPNGVDVAN